MFAATVYFFKCNKNKGRDTTFSTFKWVKLPIRANEGKQESDTISVCDDAERRICLWQTKKCESRICFIDDNRLLDYVR